jgi:hypothetical protein
LRSVGVFSHQEIASVVPGGKPKSGADFCDAAAGLRRFNIDGGAAKSPEILGLKVL